jgi:Recombination directionality factor-like
MDREFKTTMKEQAMATNAIITIQGGADASPTILGQGPIRIPTAGKIRAGIKVLTRKAAQHPQARAIYDQGLADGVSFDEVERAIKSAVPALTDPLVPRNVPWFTVREGDFAGPELARQIMEAYGEDRGDGRHLYRFPVIFPSDHWPTVMPHELASWGASDKHYWSQYSADGKLRQCMRYAPVPVDDTGRRTIRIFGGRKVVPREARGGLCEPESCPEYQQRECNLTGRFVFFIPGVRALSAFELQTTSFYAMNAAVQKFQAVAFLRGGRISGFLDRQHTPFFIRKKLMEVLWIDERGQAVRTPQWIIELDAPVDVAALLREHEDSETALVQAPLAINALEGPSASATAAASSALAAGAKEPERTDHPSLAHVLTRARDLGVEPDRFLAYADGRWGAGWRINRHGRARAWEEVERHRNDAQGYADKVAVALHAHTERGSA